MEIKKYSKVDESLLLTYLSMKAMNGAVTMSRTVVINTSRLLNQA